MEKPFLKKLHKTGIVGMFSICIYFSFEFKIKRKIKLHNIDILTRYPSCFLSDQSNTFIVITLPHISLVIYGTFYERCNLHLLKTTFCLSHRHRLLCLLLRQSLCFWKRNILNGTFRSRVPRGATNKHICRSQVDLDEK